MAVVICKGTVVKQTIASVLTAVAQVISVDVGDTKVETFDSTTLDATGSSKTKTATGYAEPGDVSMELFLDPALAGHQAITDEITTPPTSGTVWNLVFADSANTVWPFTVAGNSIGATVDMGDGLKASVTLELASMITWPT